MMELRKTNEHPTSRLPWWKKTVVYQIYPRSFMDSNGDGIGDLQGIISKLDYLKNLGVETIWFSPFFDSPQEDFGYDTRNYRDISPEYGTMADCDELIEGIHARGMRIVMDMVLNHTSSTHPWFVASRSSKDDPKRDWYVWRDGKKPGGKKPPNNWKSMITGSGWHYDERTGQFYWAQFLPFQPDLNYRNPEVRDEMLDTMKFWLNKGADGFRLDIINAVYEDVEFRDNPRSWRLLPSEKSTAMLFMNPIHTLNHPDTIEFMKVLRAVLDSFDNPERFMVGEVTAPLPILKQYMGESGDGLHMTFQFQSLGLKFKAKAVTNLIREYEKHFPEPFMPTWVFSNHDRFRRISRLGGDLLKGKLNLALQLTARGVPFIYYGEEIGMEQHTIPVKKSLDAVTFKFRKVPQFIFNYIRKVKKESLNRDECRTPMQWTSGENAGFCPPDAIPWLPITPSSGERNVAVQEDDPDSILSCCKRFLKARKTSPALNSGTMVLVSGKKIPGQVVCYARAAGGEIATVFLNFSGKKVVFTNPVLGNSLLVSTRVDSTAISGGNLVLEPWEGCVLCNNKGE
ncbi:MAG: alpha-amylase family glycosyl hydrolase [Promethearchaeota archaeon]